MTRKAKILSSVAAVAASTALLSGPALAFDNLNWTWNKTIDEQVTKNVNINADLVPTGMTEVQKLQIQVGDVTATSEVSDITNNPPSDGGGGGGVFTFSETFTVDTLEDEDDPGLDIAAISPIDGDDPANGVTGHFNGGEIVEIDDAPDQILLEFFVEGEVPIEQLPGGPLDAATELPEIESVATAVGNNQNIESAVATQLHEAQILFDVCGDCDDEDRAPVSEDVLAGVGAITDGLGNTFHEAGFSTALAAALGVIDKAEITATSTVSNIQNAYVDSDATAVGNNLNIDMSSAIGPDRLLIADLTQVSVADVSASSSVSGVSVSNYSNLAAISPVVSSTATAVGNNASINVGVPAIE